MICSEESEERELSVAVLSVTFPTTSLSAGAIVHADEGAADTLRFDRVTQGQRLDQQCGVAKSPRFRSPKPPTNLCATFLPDRTLEITGR
mmetsp:Transcript_69128/g.140563  ORF Transcript_69128/g.140563 Transcript_69128/m.140563 type:complete len:90 (+) Transcript_69128:136-405(+)